MHFEYIHQCVRLFSKFTILDFLKKILCWTLNFFILQLNLLWVPLFFYDDFFIIFAYFFSFKSVLGDGFSVWK